MCSALLGKVGCLRLAGSQPGSLGLTAYQRQRLSINYPTSPAQVGMALCPQPRVVSRGRETQQNSPGRQLAKWQEDL